MVLDEMKSKQSEIIQTLSDKIALPNMSAMREKELLNKLYDTIEEIVGDILKAL